MLTVEERCFLTDHLRAGSRTCAKYAAYELALLGAGTAVGIVLGTVLTAANRLLHRPRRPFSLFGG